MRNLYIAPTSQTPEVNFNLENQTFEVKGNSLTTNPFEFFKPIEKWIQEEIPVTKEHLTFVFKLENFNTASSRAILSVMGLLDEFENCSVVGFDDDDDLLAVLPTKPNPTNPPMSGRNKLE